MLYLLYYKQLQYSRLAFNGLRLPTIIFQFLTAFYKIVFELYHQTLCICNYLYFFFITILIQYRRIFGIYIIINQKHGLRIWAILWYDYRYIII